MPSCNTIRGMELEREQVFLGTELRPSVGGHTRLSRARLSHPLLPRQLPTAAAASRLH